MLYVSAKQFGCVDPLHTLCFVRDPNVEPY